MRRGWCAGVDIGGTFTDIVAWRAGDETVRAGKVPTRANRPMESLLAAIGQLNLNWEDLDSVVHGTTLVTNSILEGPGFPVALVASEGFGDTLEIGRQNRRETYHLDTPPKEPPLVPQQLRLEVAARGEVAGGAASVLSEREVAALADRLSRGGVHSVAICLLHGYRDATAEKDLEQELSERGFLVTTANRISPEEREFERTTTTVLAASVKPVVQQYTEEIAARKPPQSEFHLFHSAGGMASLAAVQENPLSLALSGPAAGVSAAREIAVRLGYDKAISFDMGGTTTDVCLIRNGQPEITSDWSIGDRSLRMPMVAVESIGAGGGSIASIEYGALRVGPESAGAVPGPACYGHGSKLGTVTDANVVLGYLRASDDDDGVVPLSREAAIDAIESLSSQAGMTNEEVARGIFDVANASMERALRRITVERGIEGRECALIAFGGAGPTHAVELARRIGIRQIIVPNVSSVFSAFGCAAAELSYTRQQSLRAQGDEWPSTEIVRSQNDLAEDLIRQLPQEEAARAQTDTVLSVRYCGQTYSVEVENPALEQAEDVGAKFQERHRALYGFATEDPWEVTAIRIRISVPKRSGIPEPSPPAGPKAEPFATEWCWYRGSEPASTARYRRHELSCDQILSGPVAVDGLGSTVIVPPGATLRVQASGDLVIEDERHG